jgi:hypothetical protein
MLLHLCMIAEDTFRKLFPLALQWAREQEHLVLERGVPLCPRYLADATAVGVEDPTRVRVLIVDKIPLPNDVDLAESARRSQIISDGSRGVAIGHGVIIRADSWNDRELVVHQLVHVAQCERCGSFDNYVMQYLSSRRDCAHFTIGSFEEEARQAARELCAGTLAPGR